VYWVGSVHAAWFANGGSVVRRGLPVPAAARRLLLRHQVLLRLERDYFTNHRPRLVICESPREIEDLGQIYGVPPEIMRMMAPGYDGSLFSTERRDELRGEMRDAIGANHDDIVVLMVANEWHRKGLGVLIEAVARLPDRRIRIDLVGPKDPVDYRPLAARLGLTDRLHWHGASSDAGRFYAAADIFVLPTVYEPFGNVIIEAMATGLPAVASKLAGAASAIDHGRNGLVLDDPRDVEEVAANIKLLLDPDRRMAIGAAAATAVAGYEGNHVLARLDSLIFGDNALSGASTRDSANSHADQCWSDLWRKSRAVRHPRSP
jgi:UDP-glucose:(heptosyl)LPS alpha-1,3-glucosyltransferase